MSKTSIYLHKNALKQKTDPLSVNQAGFYSMTTTLHLPAGQRITASGGLDGTHRCGCDKSEPSHMPIPRIWGQPRMTMTPFLVAQIPEYGAENARLIDCQAAAAEGDRSGLRASYIGDRLISIPRYKSRDRHDAGRRDRKTANIQRMRTATY